MYSNAINASCQPESPEELLVCVDARFPQLWAVDQECHRAVIVVEKNPRRCHLRWYVPQDRLLVDLKNNIASDERPEYG